MEEQQSYCQRIFCLPLKKVEIQKPVQPEIEEEVHFIEQFVSEVLDFSSQYGSDTSISYTAYNLTGKPSKFPDYVPECEHGFKLFCEEQNEDHVRLVLHTEVRCLSKGNCLKRFMQLLDTLLSDRLQVKYLLTINGKAYKTYGNWWKEAPSRTVEYMPQNISRIPSNDYVDVSFEESVYPFRVSIYETYNPGSVVRIWAKNEIVNKKKWALLWEGEPLKLDHIPRIFSPVIKTVNFKTSVLRIEFNHSKLEYYTGIDAVLLVGTQQPIRSYISSSNKFLEFGKESKELSSPILGKLAKQIVKLNLHKIPNNVVDLQDVMAEYQNKKGEVDISKNDDNYNGRFQCLPDETILKILGYLDLITLRKCAHLNKHFYSLCNDSFLYTRLTLRPYWDKIHDGALLSFIKKCQHLQQLDLSWCGSYNVISSSVFEKFIKSCGSNLTHIRLNCCKFVTNDVIKALAECTFLKEIALRNCSAVTESGFLHLSSLSLLEILDLYRTNVTSSSLIAILKANKNLLHLNLGSCIKINNMDEVVITLAKHNKKLISLDLWKASNLTQVGVTVLGQCTRLEEVDFGWCLGFTLFVDSLSALAGGCPRLKKLFLTALRGICDKDLEPFLRLCPDLEQIDLLGVRGITPDICSRLLLELPKLRLLDLSFCDQISDGNVSNWRSVFPHVSIKRSFQRDCIDN